MNKFITTDLGGLPLRSNDLRFIDESIRTAFKGLMSTYGANASEAVILSGCERTVVSGFVQIAPGYISIGGEICLVPAQTYLVADTVGKFEYWAIDTQWHPDGDKIFKSTFSHQTYQIRVGMVKLATSVPSGHTKVADAKNVYQVIKANLPTDTWKPLPSTSFDATMDFFQLGQPEFTRENGFVHLRGCWIKENPSSNEVLGVLPIGYRPTKNMMYYVIVNETQLTVFIKPDGEVGVWNPSSTAVQGIFPLSMIPCFK